MSAKSPEGVLRPCLCRQAAPAQSKWLREEEELLATSRNKSSKECEVQKANGEINVEEFDIRYQTCPIRRVRW